MTEVAGDRGAESPRETGIAYHDKVLSVTRRIERDHESDRNFSLRVARYSDLQRALRNQITAGGITPDIANRRTATLLAGMTASTREELESGPAPSETDMYRRVLEITEGFEQAHEADLAFAQRREHYSQILNVIQTELREGRILQEDADRQAAILLAGIDIPTTADSTLESPEARPFDTPARTLDQQQKDAEKFERDAEGNPEDQERIQRFLEEAKIRRIAYEEGLITAEEFDLLTGRLMAEKDHGMEIDELTDLYRREAFFRRLQEAISTASRHQTPLTVAFLDLDDFGAYNKEPYSHEHGDAVLNQVASYLKSRFRRGSDIVGRYGGEEIGIILSNTTEEQAVPFLDEIREEMSIVVKDIINNMGLEPPLPAQREITGTFGVAQVNLTDVGDDPLRTGMRALRLADDRMTLGKGNGKNQVVGSQREQEINT